MGGNVVLCLQRKVCVCGGGGDKKGFNNAEGRGGTKRVGVVLTHMLGTLKGGGKSCNPLL